MYSLMLAVAKCKMLKNGGYNTIQGEDQKSRLIK
jgi:hypothetical protein